MALSFVQQYGLYLKINTWSMLEAAIYPAYSAVWKSNLSNYNPLLVRSFKPFLALISWILCNPIPLFQIISLVSGDQEPMERYLHFPRLLIHTKDYGKPR